MPRCLYYDKVCVLLCIDPESVHSCLKMSTNTLCFSLLFLSPQSPARPLSFYATWILFVSVTPSINLILHVSTAARSPERACARATTLDTRPVLGLPQQSPTKSAPDNPGCSRDRLVVSVWPTSDLPHRRCVGRVMLRAKVCHAISHFARPPPCANQVYTAAARIRDATRVLAACAENMRNSLSTRR